MLLQISLMGSEKKITIFSDTMKENFIEFLDSASELPEMAAIENYERFFSAFEFREPMIDNMESVLFLLDFRVPKFIYLSPNTQYVHGYEQKELLEIGPVNFYGMIHEVDREIVTSQIFRDVVVFLNSLEETVDFNNYRFTYNYRLKQKDGSYRMLMNQFFMLVAAEDFQPLVIMGTVTDISDLYEKDALFCRIHKQDSKKRWKKVMENYYANNTLKAEVPFTNKEHQVLQYVAKGLASKEIAALTNRSIQTIHTQRKSILKKLNCANMTEAVVIGKDKGWC